MAEAHLYVVKFVTDGRASVEVFIKLLGAQHNRL